MPLVIVAFKVFLGLDVYRHFNTSWIITNVLFGLAIMALVILVSHRFGERLSRYPGIQNFMKDLAGHNINAARNSLRRISEFEDNYQGS